LIGFERRTKAEAEERAKAEERQLKVDADFRTAFQAAKPNPDSADSNYVKAVNYIMNGDVNDGGGWFIADARNCVFAKHSDDEIKKLYFKNVLDSSKGVEVTALSVGLIQFAGDDTVLETIKRASEHSSELRHDKSKSYSVSIYNTERFQSAVRFLRGHYCEAPKVPF
jgi:hypothetical protein